MWHKFEAIGTLGKDPESRYTPTGIMVCNMSIACNRYWNEKDGTKTKETMWVKVTTWGKLAETCNQHLRKGSKVFLEGRLNIDPQTGGPRIFTRKGGIPGASFEVTAEAVKFLDSKEASGEYHDAPAQAEYVDDDDAPF